MEQNNKNNIKNYSEKKAHKKEFLSKGSGQISSAITRSKAAEKHIKYLKDQKENKVDLTEEVFVKK